MSKKYEGQVLAVVLVVVVVGVIIALAIMSRTLSDQRQVSEERNSADSAEIADTVLDSIKDLDFDDVVAWADPEGGLESVCKQNAFENDQIPFNNYDFLTHGCTLNGLDDFYELTKEDSFGLTEFHDTINDSLINGCGYKNPSDTADGFKVILSTVDEDDVVEIEKDDVFSFVLGSQVPSGSCEIQIDATPLGASGAAGVIYSPLYARVAGSDITDYKPYENDDIVGQCVNSTCTSSASWVGWQNYGGVSPQSTGTQVHKAYNGTDYYLYELRVRPIGSDVEVSRSFNDLTPGGCDGVEINALIKVQAIVNCAGNSRGKEFIISKQEWAPPIFDYVLFNGDGTLENL